MRSLAIEVEPAGAGLVLALLPGGSELIESATVSLRVSRGLRTILTHSSTLGQLFPGAGLNFRIPWEGQPTKGTYRVVGVIRPEGAAAIDIDQTLTFSPANVTELEHRTAQPAPLPLLPRWLWLVLAAAAVLIVVLVVAVWRLKRRPAVPVA
jgi:hypothetical protein